MFYSFNMYKDRIVDLLKSGLGEETVKITSVVKNNGVEKEGVYLILKNPAVSPVLYFNDTKDIYDEEDIKKFIQQVIKTYSKARSFNSKRMEKLFHWETVKGYLRPRLVNYEANENKLAKQPHVRMLDLAVTFVILTEEILADFGDSAITVSDSFMDKWEVNEETLYEQAIKNMEQSGYSLKSMGINEGCLWFDGVNLGDQAGGRSGLNILCSDFVGGAAAMISTKILTEACERMRYERVYILPSSIHECLLINAEDRQVTYLKEMVHEVNEMVVDKEDYLSGNVYVFDSVKKELRVAEESNNEQNGFMDLGNIA